MANQAKPKMPRRGYAPQTKDDPPLLRVLIAEATRRGETLAAMARHLGVSYERVAQWRRREGDVAQATRVVFEAAADYLDVPTVYVMCMAGAIGVRDFSHPSRLSAREHVQRQLEYIRLDPGFAGFFPDALWTADPSVQQFVLFLYRELGGGRVKPERPYEYVRAMQLAALGDLQAQAELAKLRVEEA